MQSSRCRATVLTFVARSAARHGRERDLGRLLALLAQISARVRTRTQNRSGYKERGPGRRKRGEPGQTQTKGRCKVAQAQAAVDARRRQLLT